MKDIICKGKIALGKCDYNRSGRKNCAACITYELREDENGPEFSAQAEIWNPRGTDIYLGGQCLDEVLKFFPLASKRARRVHAIWRQFHLNGMKAGLPEQEQAVREWEAAGNRYDYTGACDMLKERGLYETPVPEGVKATGGFPAEVVEGKRGYRYGERWVYSPIPDAVIDEIKSWTQEMQPA